MTTKLKAVMGSNPKPIQTLLKFAFASFLFIFSFLLTSSWNSIHAQTVQTYNSDAVWVCPNGVFSITVECWGGGGAGGAARGNPSAAGGGAGGSYVKRVSLTVVPGTSYTLNVGTGGIGGVDNGENGEDSWFGSIATVLAKGGLGGDRINGNNQSGNGGAALTTGNIGFTAPFSYYGGKGGDGVGSATGGGGGSSAGTGSNGNNAVGGVLGAAVTGGGAGVNGSSSSADGADNINLGGGGAGGRAGSGTDRLGGNGGNGKIVLSFTQPVCPLSTTIAPVTVQNGCIGFAASAITASVTNAGTVGTPTLKYQWYYNLTNSNTVTGATLVSGATASSYTPVTTSVGVRYYFCVAYADNNGCGQTASTQSLASNTVQIGVYPNLSGSYLVGPGQTFVTLTEAINAFNYGCVNGPVTFLLTNNGGTYGASETFPLTINDKATAVKPLIIKPNTGVNTTIQSALNNNALIRIQGNYVTIDGSNNGSASRNLTISNSSVTTPYCVLFGSIGTTPIRYATLKNCNITNGVNTSTAIVLSSASTIGNQGYFNNITIQNNQIRRASIGIFAVAVSGGSNGNGLLIKSNLLNSTGTNAIKNIGIYVQGVDGANISGNNVGNFESAAAEMDRGIYLYGATVNSIIEKNTVHDLNHTGGAAFAGQAIVIGRAAFDIVFNDNNTISNNMIYNIRGKGDSYTANGASKCPVGIYVFGGIVHAGINIYHNSIYFAAGNTLGSTNAAIIGIALDDGSAATIKNNIVYNLHGGNGATGLATIGIAAETTTLQFTSLNYNDYVCTASGTSTAYIGRVAANSYTTLANWRTATTQEANSVNIAPVFVSATDLHLQMPTGNEALNNLGTPIGSITTDFDGFTRSTLQPDMGADEILSNGSWLGTTSSDWGTASNWFNNFIPTTSTNVEIGTAPNMPIISSGTGRVRDLAITETGSLTVTGTGVLQLSGSINNLGVLDMSDGTLEMNGTLAQSIPATVLRDNLLKNLIVSNSNSVSGLSLNGQVDITNSLSFGTSGLKLTTNGNLTFKSTANGTAFLGNMTGKTIDGEATVERYIPQHAKAWQFLSVPTVGQTIKEAWQENNNPLVDATPGYGVIITNNIAGAGFDIIAGVGPSMKTYQSATETWTGVSNTENTAIANPKGYMLFVRGDRSVTTTSSPATATTLRTKGILYTPANPPATVNINANTNETIGNPYPSAIDLTLLNITGGVQDVFYVWDPKLTTWPVSYGFGAMQTFTRSGDDYIVTPGGGSYPLGITKRIESGQAFFVRSVGTSGIVSIPESAKISGSEDVTRTHLRKGYSQIKTNLNVFSGNNKVLLDGNLVQFDAEFQNQVDKYDAFKLNNTGEAIGLRSNGQLLSVERRHELNQTDTIHFNLAQLRVRQYQFEIIPNRMAYPGFSAFLIDKYLGTRTEVNLNDTTRFNFSVINQPGSYAADRFYMVLVKAYPLHQHPVPVFVEMAKLNNLAKLVKVHSESDELALETASLRVFPNPVTDRMMNLEMNNLKQGIYQIQLLSNTGQLVFQTSLQVSAKQAVQKIKLSDVVSSGVYQMLVTDTDGKTKTQSVLIK